MAVNVALLISGGPESGLGRGRDGSAMVTILRPPTSKCWSCFCSKSVAVEEKVTRCTNQELQPQSPRTSVAMNDTAHTQRWCRNYRTEHSHAAREYHTFLSSILGNTDPSSVLVLNPLSNKYFCYTTSPTSSWEDVIQI